MRIAFEPRQRQPRLSRSARIDGAHGGGGDRGRSSAHGRERHPRARADRLLSRCGLCWAQLVSLTHQTGRPLLLADGRFRWLTSVSMILMLMKASIDVRNMDRRRDSVSLLAGCCTMTHNDEWAIASGRRTQLAFYVSRGGGRAQWNTVSARIARWCAEGAERVIQAEGVKSRARRVQYRCCVVWRAAIWLRCAVRKRVWRCGRRVPSLSL